MADKYEDKIYQACLNRWQENDDPTHRAWLNFAYPSWAMRVWRTTAVIEDTSTKELLSMEGDEVVEPDYEYTLFKGKFGSSEAKVEIEDTSTIDQREKAMKMYENIVLPMIPAGAFFWFLVLLSGASSYLTSVCNEGNPLSKYIPLALALTTQVVMMNYLAGVMSKTAVEGSELGKYMVKFLTCPFSLVYKFKNGFPPSVAFACLDMMGKFTRVLFVGQILNCESANPGISAKLAQSWRESNLFFLAPLIGFLGLGGLSLISFLIGPVLMQQSAFLRSLRKVRDDISKAKQKTAQMKVDEAARKPKGEDADTSMGMSETFDDIGAVASWAMMAPIGKAWDIAALPPDVEDDADAHRVWDQMKTKAIGTFVNVLPDTVFQMMLQIRFLSLTFDFNNPANTLKLAQTVFSLLVSGASASLTAVTLIQNNRRLPTFVGVILIVMLTDPMIRVLGLFICDSHVLNVTSFSCAALS